MTKNQPWCNTKVSVTKNFKYIKQIGDCCWCVIQSVSRMAQAVTQHTKEKKTSNYTTLYTLFKNSWLYMCWFVCSETTNQNFSIFKFQCRNNNQKISKSYFLRNITVRVFGSCCSDDDDTWRDVVRWIMWGNLSCWFNSKLANILTFFCISLALQSDVSRSNVNCIVMFFFVVIWHFTKTTLQLCTIKVPYNPALYDHTFSLQALNLLFVHNIFADNPTKVQKGKEK